MGRRGESSRYARELAWFSPPAMVAAVTERRRQGDWRGVCAAGRVDVHLDLRDVAARHGTDQAARIEADLRGFAPDLLRRFLPRTTGSTLLPQARIVLSRWSGPLATPEPADRSPSEGPHRPSEPVPVLIATTPRSVWAPQRLTLRVGAAHELTGRWYDLPDWCWHADAVAARRWAYGGAETRLAWHAPDGTPYRPGAPNPVDAGTVESGITEPPVDRATQVETIDALLAAGRTVEAYRVAGCDVDQSLTEGDGWERRGRALLARLAPTLSVLAAESQRLARRYGRARLYDVYRDVVLDLDAERPTVRAATWHDRRAAGPELPALRAPIEAALLSRGLLTADDLHPLVHEALFPGRAQAWRVPPPAPIPTIWIRCGADRHALRVTDGRLAADQHTEEELRRELLLAGLGGPISGCAAAVRAWRAGAKPVPKRIRLIRRDVFALARHGDTDTLLALLAAGFDPSLRDGEGGTLMHWLHRFDHTELLPRLLAAGLSVDERDRNGDTPLHRAARAAATEVMTALVEAGADPEARDSLGRTPAAVLAAAQGRRGR